MATAISGKVFGGEQPISGATIQLWETGTSGYGSGATLLEACGTTANNTGVFSCPTANVPSNCTNGPFAYITAAGGDPTGQTQTAQNHALLNVAMLGTCTSVGANTYVVINEVTTVAAAYAMNSFSTVSGAGGSLASLSIGAPTTNAAGLADAVANAALLVNSQFGQATQSTPTQQVPTAAINSLANTVSACTNASDYNVSPCTTFFGYATPPGGTKPTNNFQALMNIAKYPGQNVTAILQLAPTNPPFYPALVGGTTTSSTTTVLNDLSLGIAYPNFTFANSKTSAVGVAIDATDNVWVLGAGNGTSTTTYNYIGELPDAASGGAYTATLATVAALNGTHTVRNGAFDTLGNFWLSDKGTSTGGVIEIPTGTTQSSAVEYNFLTTDSSLDPNDWMVAIDATNNIWVASYGSAGNCSTSLLCDYVEFPKGSTPPYTATDTFNGSKESAPTSRGIVADNVSTSPGAGKIWATNLGVVGASTTGSTVEVLTPSTGALSTINLSSSTAANAPWGIAIDNTGGAYVTTESNQPLSGLYYVPQNTANGSTISNTVSASSISGIADTTNAPASTATTAIARGGFNNPVYVTIDGAKNVWVANNNYGTIVEYSPSLAGYLSPYYGFAPSVSTTVLTSITKYAISSNVVTFTAVNTLTAGQVVTLTGFPTATFFNGQQVTVLSSNNPTTNTFTANFTHANVSSTTESGFAVSAANALNQALFTCTTISSTTTCAPAGLANKKSLIPMAIDRAGSVWSMDSAGTLLEIIGTATPTNPILAAGQAGSLP